MSEPTGTGFDVHVPSSAVRTLLPWVVAGALGLTSGGGASTFLDVSGARAYKEAQAEKIAESERLARELAECRAQKSQVIDLLDGATLREDIQ